MTQYILVFQIDDTFLIPGFQRYLKQQGWNPYSRGVYQKQIQGRFDRGAMWEHCRKEFGLDPGRDFFAIFDCGVMFRGGNAHFDNRQAPYWPHADSSTEAE